MILEIADFRILAGHNAAFEEAIQRALSSVAARAKGFRRASVQHGIESPQRYVLQIVWETLEDHTVGFRGGPLFAEWRALIGPFFDGAPSVEHFEFLSPADDGSA